MFFNSKPTSSRHTFPMLSFKLVFSRPYTAILVEWTKLWHFEVGPSVRNQLVLKLVDSMCLAAPSVPTKEQLHRYIELAQMVERAGYESADSTDDYFERLYEVDRVAQAEGAPRVKWIMQSRGTEEIAPPKLSSPLPAIRGTEELKNFPCFSNVSADGRWLGYESSLDAVMGERAVLAKNAQPDPPSQKVFDGFSRIVMIYDLMQAIIPKNTELPLDKMKHVLEYARAMEANVYEACEEQTDCYTQSMQQLIRQTSQAFVNEDGSTHAFVLARDYAARIKDWQSKIIKDHRDHCVGELIDAISAQEEYLIVPQHIKDSISYRAQKLELKCYKAANSRREYLELVAAEMSAVANMHAPASSTRLKGIAEVDTFSKRDIEVYFERLGVSLEDVARKTRNVGVSSSDDKEKEEEEVNVAEEVAAAAEKKVAEQRVVKEAADVERVSCGMQFFGQGYGLNPPPVYRHEDSHAEIDRFTSMEPFCPSFYPNTFVNRIPTPELFELTRIDRSNDNYSLAECAAHYESVVEPPMEQDESTYVLNFEAGHKPVTLGCLFKAWQECASMLPAAAEEEVDQAPSTVAVERDGEAGDSAAVKAAKTYSQTMKIPETSSFALKFEKVTPKSAEIDKDWFLPCQRSNIVELRKFFLDKFLMTRFAAPNEPVPEEDTQSVIEALQNEELECYQNSSSMNNYIMTTVLRLSETYNELSAAAAAATAAADDKAIPPKQSDDESSDKSSYPVTDDSRSTDANLDIDDWIMLDDSSSSNSSSSCSSSSTSCSSSEDEDP